MKALLSIRPSRALSVVLLALGVLALLVALFGFGSRVIGSVCLDGWLSDSTGAGRCSGHGGAVDDREVNTLVGQQPGNWIWLAKWPLSGLGLVGSGLGASGLLRHRADKKRDQLTGGPARTVSPRLGGPAELVVNVDVSAGGYVAELLPPVGSSARHILQAELPVDRGLGELQEELRLPNRRRIGSKRNRAVERFGSTLFDALFDGPLEAVYRASLDHAISIGTRLNVVLHLDDGLADIPWEYLYDHKRGAYLSLSQDTSLSRQIATIHSTSPLPAANKLRILIMGASPTGLEPLAIDAEQRQIEAKLSACIANGQVELRSVQGSSFDDLRAALDDFEPHVFHFSGHGSWDEDLDDGVVVFANQAGSPQQQTGRDLGVLLNRTHLRLAVFNSCDAGRASKTDRFAGIATSLVAQGVPAAVGMQFRFDDSAATVFGCAFLGRLADTRSIADALFAARTAVFTMPNDIEWATPVLTARVPLDQILTQPQAARAGRR